MLIHPFFTVLARDTSRFHSFIHYQQIYTSKMQLTKALVPLALLAPLISANPQLLGDILTADDSSPESSYSVDQAAVQTGARSNAGVGAPVQASVPTETAGVGAPVQADAPSSTESESESESETATENETGHVLHAVTETEQKQRISQARRSSQRPRSAHRRACRQARP